MGIFSKLKEWDKKMAAKLEANKPEIVKSAERYLEAKEKVQPNPVADRLTAAIQEHFNLELEDFEATNRAKRVDIQAQEKLVTNLSTLANSQVEANIATQEMMKRIMAEVDAKNITSEQAFLLLKIMQPGNDPHINQLGNTKTAMAELDKMKIDNRIKTAEARREEAQAELDEYTVKETIRPDPKG